MKKEATIFRNTPFLTDMEKPATKDKVMNIHCMIYLLKQNAKES